jgi:hypothetical protein
MVSGVVRQRINFNWKRKQKRRRAGLVVVRDE